MRLETERLILREYSLDDTKHIAKYATDDRYTEFHLPRLDYKKVEEFVENCIKQQNDSPRKSFELLITKKGDNTPIGGIKIIANGSNAELGYALNHKHYGNGYITEAAIAMLNFAFNELNIHRVFAYCNTKNTPSEKVMVRLNMKLEGIIREDRKVRDKWIDNKLYSILKPEFKG